MNIDTFTQLIKEFYKNNKRNLEWRENITPYRIFVSEIMLQQTQVTRVQQKFPEFIQLFPTFEALAEQPLRNVMVIWQGMGYNRRAIYLKQAAETVIEKYKGILYPSLLNLRSKVSLRRVMPLLG